MENFEEVFKEIQKKHGKESICKLDGSQIEQIPVVSTGSLSLDRATGVWGVPRGRIIEIFGPEMSGKTMMSLHIIRNSQRQGELCGFIDAEHSLDLGWAKRLGVQTDNLLFSQPDSGEEALEIVLTMVQSGSVSVIVVDSVAALVPKAELEGDMGQAQMGLQARLMSQAMRKLNGPVFANNVILIFINQLRKKIGVIWGSPEVTTGGEALKYYASMRMDVRKVGKIERGDEQIGYKIRTRIIKNKVAVPYTEAEFDCYNNIGFLPQADLVDLAIDAGILVKVGAYIKDIDGQTIGHGRDAAVAALQENQELFDMLLEKTRTKIGIPV